jgi:hypothetical protein
VKDTLEHRLYEKFSAMFPGFMNGEYETLRLEAEHAKPLELEWVFGDTISIAHTYELNGETAYEPRVMLTLGSEEKTLTAHSLELTKPPRMDNVYAGSGIADLERQRNINDFTLQWLDRAEKQRFKPVEATYCVDEQGKVSREGLITDKTVKVTFDADGNMIMPEAEPDTTELPEPSKPNPMFPDPTVTPAERDAYGYTESDMHPLGREKALELFDAGQTVYLLYPDNTEAMAFDRDEIITFTGDGGLCGVSHADWQFSGEFKTQAILSGFREDALESDLLFGSESKFGIYQIPDYIEDYRDFLFASIRDLEAKGLTPDRNHYKLVYTAPLTIHDTQTNAHKIFADFQHDSPECPSDFTERSVSVSDVIVLQWRGEVSAHYVDSIGFEELPSFTGNEREQNRALSQIDTRTNVTELAKASNAESKENPRIINGETPPQSAQKPQNKGVPTLMDEINEAKQLVNRNGQGAAKQNEREV